MKGLQMKKEYTATLIVVVFMIFIAMLSSCNKHIDKTLTGGATSSNNVTLDQIKDWASSFLPKLSDPPILLYLSAQKKSVNGRSYVRIPALVDGSAEGSFYFTRTPDGKLQSLYVIIDQPDKTKLDGTVGFTDLENQTYTVTTYQNNKPVALYSVKDNKTLFDGVFNSNSTGFIRKQVADACSEQTSIIKLPDGRDSIINRKVNGSGIPCPGTKTFWQKLWGFLGDVWGGLTDAFDFLFGWIGGGSDGSYSGGSSFGNGGYGNWDFNNYGVGYGNGGSNYTGDPGAAWGPYDPFSNSEGYPYDDSFGEYSTDDAGDNNSDYSGPGVLIPSTIILSNGSSIQIKFGRSQSDGKSANQLVAPRVLECLIFVLNDLSNSSNITSLEINCTTNGLHSTTASNHYRGLAVDIDILNGYPVTPGLDIANQFQISLDKYANIRENFGPLFKHKLRGPWPSAPDHNNHIHFSVNGN